MTRYFFDYYKDSIIRLLLWLLMLLSLIASMRHVAWLFSTLELGGQLAGWISAAGFDLSIFLLTLIAHKYKEGTPQRRFIRAGIYANAMLSAWANVMHGIEHQQQLARVDGLMWYVMPFIFSLALPMMVVFLAEVLSREEDHQARAFERREAKAARLSQTFSQAHGQTNGQTSPEPRQISRQDKVEQVRQILKGGPARNRQIVTKTGFGRASVSEYLAELLETGQIFRQGHYYHLAKSGQESGENLAETQPGLPSGGTEGGPMAATEFQAPGQIPDKAEA